MKRILKKEFIDFLKKNNPEIIDLDPKIIEVIGDIIVFKCKNEPQQYCLSLKG